MPRPGLIVDAAVSVIAARLSIEVPGLEQDEVRRIAHRAAADLTQEGFKVTAPAAALAASHRRTRRPT
ncbi:hypothetical protein AB0F46_01840 [Streptomyces sp. NPDC026665]|uniref:hypothetical protein n=1 Tax=Streptomyces sp. NPDC026665 TaxID=3154798 RepID=UPI0033FD9D2A